MKTKIRKLCAFFSGVFYELENPCPDCTIQCSEIIYQPFVSSATFPSRSAAEDIVTSRGMTVEDIRCLTTVVVVVFECLLTTALRRHTRDKWSLFAFSGEAATNLAKNRPKHWLRHRLRNKK